MPIKLPKLENDVQYQLRLNEKFREQLKKQAADNGRTLNAEIISILSADVAGANRAGRNLKFDEIEAFLNREFAKQLSAQLEKFSTIERASHSQLNAITAIEARLASIEKLLVKLASES